MGYKILYVISMLLCGIIVSGGCVRRYSYFYNSDDLLNNLTRAEIVYMENSEVFLQFMVMLNHIEFNMK